MELKSEYMLLSAPYRFELHHLTPLALGVIAEDLLSIAIPQRASESGDSAMRGPTECVMRKLVATDGRAGTEDGTSALRLIADAYGRFPDKARISNDFSFTVKETYLPGSGGGAGGAAVGSAAQAFDAPWTPDSAQTLDPARVLALRLGPFEKLGVKKANEAARESLAFQPVNLVIDQTSCAASSKQWRVPVWLMVVADNHGLLGSNDAFVVSLLSATYSSRLIDDEAVAEALEHYGGKIAALYTGWGQFLASCALDAILAGEPSNGGSNDGSLLSAVYGFAVSPASVFEAAELWPRPNLSRLTESLAPLSPAQTLTEYKAYVNVVKPPVPKASHVLDPQRFAPRIPSEETRRVLVHNSASQAEYGRCYEVTGGIWTKTACRHRIDLTPLDPANVAAVHLPDLSHKKGSEPAYSNRFWPVFKALKDEVEGVPFAWTDCPGPAGSLVTSSCAYRIVREMEVATPTATQIPWDRTEFRCAATDSNCMATSISGEAMCELNVDYEALGLPGAYCDKDPEIVAAALNPHIERLDSFFADLPWRVMDRQWYEG